MKDIKQKVILIAVLAFVALTAYLLWYQAQPKPEVFRLDEAQTRDITDVSVINGTIESLKYASLTSPVNGIVEKILVKEGETVRKGQVVAQIRIIQDAMQIDRSRDVIHQATISLEEVQREYNRTSNLVEKGVLSRQELQKMETQLQLAKQRLEAARSQEEILRKGSSASVGDVKTTDVKATMDGRITTIIIKEGNSVIGLSEPLMKIADLESLSVVAYVDETDIAATHEGMTLAVHPGALPGVEIPAVIEHIADDSQLRNGNHMYEVKASMQMPGGVIVRNGYSVNADLVKASVEKVTSISEAAVEYTDEGCFVYRCTNEDVPQEFEKIAVKLGVSDGLYVEVKSGVKSGDKLKILN